MLKTKKSSKKQRAKMLKIDLHTHSIASPDGSITLNQYKNALGTGVLDSIAITDHDSIEFATKANQELGNKIIIGEEISTTEGEIIGLYLNDLVQPGLSASETVAAIKKQGGLVHIPHPFETVRKGIQLDALETIAEDVDSIEALNGRSLQKRDKQTLEWAKKHSVPTVAASDAHRYKALGKTYTVIAKAPTALSLPRMLRDASITYRRPSFGDIIAPKKN